MAQRKVLMAFLPVTRTRAAMAAELLARTATRHARPTRMPQTSGGAWSAAADVASTASSRRSDESDNEEPGHGRHAHRHEHSHMHGGGGSGEYKTPKWVWSLPEWAQDNAAKAHRAATDKWMEMEEAPRNSFQGRVHTGVVRLMERITPEEVFLRSFSSSSIRDAKHYPPTIVIHRPPDVTLQHVLDEARAVADAGLSVHQRGRALSIAALPISLILGCLPGPNVVLYWNLYRIWGHHMALRGANTLLDVLEDDAPGVFVDSPSEGLGELSTEACLDVNDEGGALSPEHEAELEFLAAELGFKSDTVVSQVRSVLRQLDRSRRESQRKKAHSRARDRAQERWHERRTRKKEWKRQWRQDRRNDKDERD